MGRKSYAVSEKDKRIVENMVGMGATEAMVSMVLGLDPKTLRKHFRTELDTGHIKATMQVAQSLFKKATSDGPQSVTACIFWLKCRGGENWKDTSAEYVSKKEEAQWAAKRAGLGTEWGDDLTTTPPSQNEIN